MKSDYHAIRELDNFGRNPESSPYSKWLRPYSCGSGYGQFSFTNTEPRPPHQSGAVDVAGVAPEGPGRDAHKPLMRKRASLVRSSPIGYTAPDIFSLSVGEKSALKVRYSQAGHQRLALPRSARQAWTPGSQGTHGSSPVALLHPADEDHQLTPKAVSASVGWDTPPPAHVLGPP